MTAAKIGIHAAFVKAQAEMTSPKKGSDNPFFHSKYADLTECWRACKDALAENDIGVMQGVFGDRLRTTLVHSSGETLEDEGIPLLGYANAKNPAQALGASLTYSRRYGLCAMLGMAPEDDDGNSLVQDNTTNQPAITADQKNELIAAIKERASEAAPYDEWLKRMLGWADIKNLDIMPASKFNEAMDIISAAGKESA